MEPNSKVITENNLDTNEFTSRDIAQILSLTTDTIRTYFRELIKLGYIERFFQRQGFPSRYKITDNGKTILSNLPSDFT